MKRTRRLVLWVVGFALLLAPVYCPPKNRPAPQPSFALRLLGPVASLAAGLQWSRVDSAIRSGRTDVALARAETALAIDPRSTDGWVFTARYMAFDLASPEREPDAERRLAWLRAALAVLERGESTAADRPELVLQEGLYLARAATLDEHLPWPDGVRGMWLEAAARFDRLRQLGHPLAAELAQRARDEAELAGKR